MDLKVMKDWQKNVTALSVIYMMLEKGKKLPLVLEGDDQFVEPILEQMHEAGLLAVAKKDDEWIVTDKGRALRTQMVGMYDQMSQFEIFGAVNIERQLTSEEEAPEDPGQVYDNALDPRFAEDPSSKDLRLGMIDFIGQYMAEKLEGKAIDPYAVVFMQKLADKEFDVDHLWFDLRVGALFKQVEEIVDSAYKWRDAASTEDNARAAMAAIYTAGLLEQRKREGNTCSSCGFYLAVYELKAARENQTLTECPCGAKFVPPAAESGEQCPNCGAVIGPRQRKCRGCGARIDRSLPEGTVSEETVVREEVVCSSPWGYDYDYYGYTPVVAYYDPWDPFVDLAAFSLLCFALW